MGMFPFGAEEQRLQVQDVTGGCWRNWSLERDILVFLNCVLPWCSGARGKMGMGEQVELWRNRKELSLEMPELRWNMLRLRGKLREGMDFFWVVWESRTVLFYLEF